VISQQYQQNEQSPLTLTDSTYKKGGQWLVTLEIQVLT